MSKCVLNDYEDEIELDEELGKSSEVKFILSYHISKINPRITKTQSLRKMDFMKRITNK